MMRILLATGIAALMLLSAGCGGGSVFGVNSEIDVVVDSLEPFGAADSLVVSISPLDGAWDSPAAGGTHRSQPWLNRFFANNFQEFVFTTNSVMVPYRLYIGNDDTREIRTRVRIYVDDELRYSETFWVPARQVPVFETRIFRNNVENQLTGRTRGSAEAGGTSSSPVQDAGQ